MLRNTLTPSKSIGTCRARPTDMSPPPTFDQNKGDTVFGMDSSGVGGKEDENLAGVTPRAHAGKT